MKQYAIPIACLAIGLGLGLATRPVQTQPMPAMNGQRWQVIMHPQFRGMSFLLDTQSGRNWQVVETASGGQAWQEMEMTSLKVPNISTMSDAALQRAIDRAKHK